MARQNVVLITDIPAGEIQFDYIRADGPGGQNVNKVATAAQLRFDVARSQALSAEVKARLIKIAGRRMTSEGVLILSARRFRTQEGNRADALRRLHELLERASRPPKARRAIAVPRAARESRLEGKRRRAAVKRTRRITPDSHET